MRNKGFTLIELLAVIVILAIIALIATPIVLNIIEDTKSESKERSAELYLKALNLTISDKQLKNEIINDGTYRIIANGNLCSGVPSSSETCIGEMIEIKMDGEKPDFGTVIIKDRKIQKILSLSFTKNNIIFNSLDGNTFIRIDKFNVWDGTSATALDNLTVDESTKTVEINSAADLAGFRDAVNAGNLHGYTANLNVSIDLNTYTWSKELKKLK